MIENPQITDRKEIIRLLRMAKYDNAPMYVRVGLKEYFAVISKITEDLLIFDCKGQLPVHTQYIEFYFSYQKKLYFCQLKILDRNEFEELVIAFPEVINSRKDRKYKRIKTFDVACKFNIISIENGKAEEKKSEIIPYPLRMLFYELKKDVPDVKKIFAQIGEEMKKISKMHSMKLYKKNEDLTETEKILSKYKETLFIYDVNNPRSYLINYKKRIMSFSRYFKEKLESKEWSQDDIRNNVKRISQQDIKLKRHSYVYSPLFLFNDVVGHIFVANNPNGQPYSEKDVLFIKAMADVVNDALVKAKLFQIDSGPEMNMTVIDLSLGGMMVSVTDPYILKYLKPGTKLKVGIKMQINFDVLECTGEIIRVQKYGDKVNVGIKFLELTPKYEKYIGDYVESINVSDIM